MMNTSISNILPWEQRLEPYYVNDIGLEWYKCSELDDYVRNQNDKKGSNITLHCFIIRRGSLVRYVILDKKSNPIFINSDIKRARVFIETYVFANK